MASRRRDLTATDAYLSSRQGWAPPCIRRHGEISNRSLLARSHSILRVFSRRQRRGYWCQPPDRLDGIGGEAYPTIWGISYSGAANWISEHRATDLSSRRHPPMFQSWFDYAHHDPEPSRM